MQPAPIFTQLPDGRWLPEAVARGPFDGMQGGLVAALMSAAVEASVEGFLASATSHFLRPVPLEPLQVSVEPIRLGRRVSVLDVRLATDQGVVALQRATVIRPGAGENLPTPERRVTDPEALAPAALMSQREGPWLMDVMDMRRGPDGVAWFRQQRPTVERPSPMCAVLPAADFAHGFAPPMGCDERPAVAIPNPDVTVHLFRAPVGPWVGVEAASAWSSAAIGAGWAALHDIEGLIGRVAMSIAIMEAVR